MSIRKRILILTDFTNTCYQSLTYGLEFCRHYGFEPEILHVESANSDNYVDAIERQKVSNVVELYNRKFGLGAKVVIKTGRLTEAILDESRYGRFSIIILGTHGRVGFQTVTGSAAAKIISSQEIPIIVVQSRRFMPISKVLMPVPFGVDCPCVELRDLVRMLGAEWKIFHREDTSDSNLSRQAIDYAISNGFDLILCSYDDCRNIAQSSYMVDQLLFNIPQIPVLCG